MMAKAADIPADMTFLDLEDACAPLEKQGRGARSSRPSATLDWGDRVLCVRVNAWDTEWTVYDVHRGGRQGR